MQSNADTQLTDTQIQRLAELVLEDHGRDLGEADLDEVIALLLEDVAGYELASAAVVNDTLNAIRSKYYECCNGRNGKAEERRQSEEGD